MTAPSPSIERDGGGGPGTVVWIVGVALVAGAAALVASSLQRPPVPSHPPSAVAPEPVGDRLVGPTTYTVDASDRWIFFDFSRGSAVPPEDARGARWDLAFNRFKIVANGGDGFPGRGGVRDLGEVAFDSVRSAPGGGYVESRIRGDSTNAALEDWYDYSWTSHILTPKPHVWAVRTADGRYAKIEILGYYCPGARPGCVTFRYVYQGGEGSSLVP